MTYQTQYPNILDSMPGYDVYRIPIPARLRLRSADKRSA